MVFTLNGCNKRTKISLAFYHIVTMISLLIRNHWLES